MAQPAFQGTAELSPIKGIVLSKLKELALADGSMTRTPE